MRRKIMQGVFGKKMIKLKSIVRGNLNSFEFLRDEYFKKKYELVEDYNDADVVWVEWANEQSVDASFDSPKRNVIVRALGSEYYQNFWAAWGGQIHTVISVNPLYKFPVHTVYIPGFVDTDFWKPLPGSKRRNAIAMVGNFDYVKNQLGLLRLLAERPKYFNEVLLVGGITAQKDWKKDQKITTRKIIQQLVYFAQQHGINLQLIDHQFKMPLREIYNSVKFVVSNSINEGCHAVIQEAMSCDTKVLVADWMGSRDIFFEPYIYSTAKEFWLLVDHYPKKELREWAKRYFSMEVILPQIDKVIEGVYASNNIS